MKALLLGAVAILGAVQLPAQEIELPPIVVEGTFELRQRSIIDLFTLHLEKQMESKRVIEEAVSRSPLFYARFWDYLGGLRLESSSNDSAQFFTPRYLTLEYQNSEQALRKLEKESVFKSP